MGNLSVRELESGEQLLRFREPLAIEEGYGPAGELVLRSPLLDLEVAGASEEEAWRMFSDVIVSTFAEYRNLRLAPDYPLARKQWEAVQATAAKLYALQAA